MKRNTKKTIETLYHISIFIGTSLNINLGLPMRGATWIYLPWESSESEENLYSITWQRDTTVGCPCEDTSIEENDIPNRSESYNITDLEEDSRYRIVVNAMTIDGQSSSISVTATTLEAGERNLMLINPFMGIGTFLFASRLFAALFWIPLMLDMV